MTRGELVRAAGETIYRGSKSFRLASLLFDRQTRERAWLLYCWCRHCDDECDGQTLGLGSRQSGAPVEEVAKLTERAIAGDFGAMAPKHRVVVHAPQRVPVAIDPDRLTEVVTNLVTNAAKYA